jgi:hypothetical protein
MTKERTNDLFMSYHQKFQLSGWWVITENFNCVGGGSSLKIFINWAVITKNFNPLGKSSSPTIAIECVGHH